MPLAALSLFATARLGAQGADSARAATRPPPAGPGYPVAPSPVLDTRTLTRGPAFSGYLSVRQTRRNDSTTIVVNRARLTVMGAPRPYLAYRVQGDFSAVGRLNGDSTVPASVLTDAYVQLSLPGAADSGRARSAIARGLAALQPVLIVGQFRTPLSLEYLTPFSLLKTANRSLVVDRIATRRDVGAMTQLRLGALVTVAAALTNGEGANATRNVDDAELAVGRLTLRPTRALAVAAKWAGQGPDHLWGYDARWQWRGATVEGEALHRKGRVPGATGAVPPSPPYAAGGSYVLAAYKLLPWLEPVAKWERFREEVAVSAGGSPVSESWLTTGAVVHDSGDRLRLQLNWVVKRTHPIERRANELLAQLVAIY